MKDGLLLAAGALALLALASGKRRPDGRQPVQASANTAGQGEVLSGGIFDVFTKNGVQTQANPRVPTIDPVASYFSSGASIVQSVAGGVKSIRDILSPNNPKFSPFSGYAAFDTVPSKVSISSYDYTGPGAAAFESDPTANFDAPDFSYDTSSFSELPDVPA